MHNAFERLRIDAYSRVPIAVQLAEQIAWLIAGGRIGRNDRLPALRALAVRLGVNVHTVAAAYRQLEADGLVSTRQGRGTVVLGYDRSRRSSHSPDVPSFTVGVLIDEHSAAVDPFLEALQGSGEKDATLFVVGVTHGRPARVASYLDRFVAKNVDGVVIASLGRPEDPALTASLLLAFSMPPIVYVDLPSAQGPKVLLDLETGVYKAVDHILAHGHRRVGLLAGPPGWPRSEPLSQGYRRAHSDRSLPTIAELAVECPDLTPESGRASAGMLLDLELPPTAILAATSELAFGAIRSARDRGKRIPEEIAIVSCDDPVTAALVEPPLTAVRLPMAEMGRQAMSMLGTLIAGGTVRPSIIILPTQLIVRRSCGCQG
jgi:DNA-binding LacI/PurR family transcriptional regulator